MLRECMQYIRTIERNWIPSLWMQGLQYLHSIWARTCTEPQSWYIQQGCKFRRGSGCLPESVQASVVLITLCIPLQRRNKSLAIIWASRTGIILFQLAGQARTSDFYSHRLLLRTQLFTLLPMLKYQPDSAWWMWESQCNNYIDFLCDALKLSQFYASVHQSVYVQDALFSVIISVRR